MNEYTFDKEGNEWIGVRPEFTDKLKKLNSKYFNSGLYVSS